MIAIERGAELVLQRDTGRIEPAAARDRKAIGHVERVERIEPLILVEGAKRHRTNRCRFARGAQEYAAARDDIVRAHGCQFGGAVEARAAGIKACANHEAVLMPEQLIAVGRLPRYASRRRSRAGAIDLAEYGIRRKWIDELSAIQAKSGGRIIAKAQERWIGTRLGVGRVSVHSLMTEAPHMRRAFKGPGRR